MGFRITAIELGNALAAQARHRLRPCLRGHRLEMGHGLASEVGGLDTPPSPAARTRRHA
ncbi:hypothetical protein ACRYCC_19800 [Actinomadura scrupuli]|uniref:hypothetical protein n=1 Tax=Actinomadura scrupuli TaxID=559629 RepID=UPI003D968AEA